MKELYYYRAHFDALKNAGCMEIYTDRTLQDMFTAAFSFEDKRLDQIILSIPVLIQKQLMILINRDDGISQLNVARISFLLLWIQTREKLS